MCPEKNGDSTREICGLLVTFEIDRNASFQLEFRERE